MVAAAVRCADQGGPSGDGTFAQEAQFGLRDTNTLAWGDADNDGDLDVAAGIEHSPATNSLYVNDENDGDDLVLHLVGHRHDLGDGYSNRDGIGARVDVFEAGFLGDPAHRLGMREIEAHGGFSSQGAIDAHFGLPNRTAVDVRVLWPGSGGSRIVQFLAGLAVGQRYVVDEQGTPTGVPAGAAGPRGRGIGGDVRLSVAPNPTRGSTLITAALPPGSAPSLALYDASGRLVRVLEFSASGASGLLLARWDGRDQRGRPSAAGVYFAGLSDARSARPARIVVVH